MNIHFGNNPGGGENKDTPKPGNQWNKADAAKDIPATPGKTSETPAIPNETGEQTPAK